MEPVDILIKNAYVIDGTGKEAFNSNIGIKGKKIVYLGKEEDMTVKTCIDAGEQIVSPGFIDTHGHMELDIIKNIISPNKVEQGITTEIGGLCGLSLVPISDKYFAELMRYVGVDANKTGINKGSFIENWQQCKTYNSYIKELEKIPLLCNYGFYVGQGTVRLAVMGFENRDANKTELEKMKDYIREGMENGAIGLSSGLIYPPGVFTPKNEIIELCKVITEYGGVYSTHMRNEGSDVVNSVKESIDIGRQTGVRVVISHHKIFGKKNWGKSVETLKLIDEAIAEGIDISLDVYPYTAGATYLHSTIPPSYHAGGKDELLKRLLDPHIRDEIKEEILNSKTQWENMVKNCGFEGILVTKNATEQIEGKRIAEYAKEMGMEPIEALFNILIETKGNAFATLFGMDEKDVENILKYQYTSIITDAMMDLGNPRAVGTFPRVLGRYVRERKIISLEEAIRKMTLLPASKMGLKNKGIIKEGYDADIVIFEPSTIIDRADYFNPYAKNEGIKYVLINGKIVLKNNIYTGEPNGEYLKQQR